MRAVVQRVSQASVKVSDSVVGAIGPGLLILLGVANTDTSTDALWLARKVAGLRIFAGDDGKMQFGLVDHGGGALVVSQFTLYGDCSKGRRPNFSNAAPPEQAESLYELFCEALRHEGVKDVQQGKFGAMMQVDLCNDGPVTLIVESPGVKE